MVEVIPEGTSRGKPLSCEQLVDALCDASVPLREARRAHVAIYGTLIPHVFMGAVLARVGDCLIAGTEHAAGTGADEVKGILAALEAGMLEGDREARNVVAISFVRDAEVEPFFRHLRPLLGRATSAQVRGK